MYINMRDQKRKVKEFEKKDFFRHTAFLKYDGAVRGHQISKLLFQYSLPIPKWCVVFL